MTLEAADAIAGLLNGLLREGWRAAPSEWGEPYWVRVYKPGSTWPYMLVGPAEAAEFIREHLG